MDLLEVINMIIFLEICFSNLIPIVTLLGVVVKTCMNRKLSGISMNFLLFWTVAALFKSKLDSQPGKLEIPASLVVLYIMHYVVQLTLIFFMASTFSISLWFMNIDGKKIEDKFDIWCFPIGFIVSLILGVDHYRSREKDMWMIGSYLEVAAWIPQLKLSLKRKPVDLFAVLFIISMFIYEIVNDDISDLFYQLNLNFVYKPSLLKCLLFCGFIFNYWQWACSTKNKVNKVLPATPAQATLKKNLWPRKGSDKPVHCIRVKAAVSLTEQGLMTRY